MAELAVLFLATLAAGFLRGVTGFGFALAAVPFFSLSIEPVYAIILAQILQIAAAPVDVYHHHRKLDREALGLLCLGALVFTPLGAFFATRLPPDLMRLTIAAVVLLGLLALILKVRIRDGKGPAITAGALSGLLAGLAAMPGPPAVAYFLGRGVDKTASRASLLVFFAFTAAVALVSVALGSGILRWDMFLFGAACYPALLLGSALGGKLFQRLGDGHYRIGAIAVLFVSALITGAKGFSGLFQ